MEEKTQKKSSGKALSLVIGLVIGAVITAGIALCLMKTGSKTCAKIEGAGYSSPEKAVEAYVNYLKEGNLEGAVSTFAVESYVENFDMTGYYEYIRTFNPYNTCGRQSIVGLYSDSELTNDLLIESRKSYILAGIQRQLLQIIKNNTDNEDLEYTTSTGNTYVFDNPDEAETIIDFLSIDPELDTIEIGDFLDNDDFDVPEEAIERQLEADEEIWDTDTEMVIVELEIDGEDYTLFMLCVCYDGKWYIGEFDNNVGFYLGLGYISMGLISDEDLEYYY